MNHCTDDHSIFSPSVAELFWIGDYCPLLICPAIWSNFTITATNPSAGQQRKLCRVNGGTPESGRARCQWLESYHELMFWCTTRWYHVTNVQSHYYRTKKSKWNMWIQWVVMQRPIVWAIKWKYYSNELCVMGIYHALAALCALIWPSGRSSSEARWAPKGRHSTFSYHHTFALGSHFRPPK